MVSHLGRRARALREERRREEEEQDEEGEENFKYGFVRITMGLYGVLDFCMDCMDYYGFVWICMDISLFHFLGLVKNPL